MTELEEVVREKAKKILLDKLKDGWAVSVGYTANNPNFPKEEQQNYNNFKVSFLNRETRKRRSFVFSQGTGVKETDNDSVLFGLLTCFFLDLPYTDLEEFDGLGYTGKKAVKIYKAICKQYDNLKYIWLLEWLENLTDKEKELLN